MIASVFPGVDVAALTALPLAIGSWGLPISITLSLTVIYYLISDDPY